MRPYPVAVSTSLHAGAWGTHFWQCGPDSMRFDLVSCMVQLDDPTGFTLAPRAARRASVRVLLPLFGLRTSIMRVYLHSSEGVLKALVGQARRDLSIGFR